MTKACTHLRRLLRARRNGCHDATLANLKELALYLFSDKEHPKKQAELLSWFIELEMESERLYNTEKQGVLTQPWRG